MGPIWSCSVLFFRGSYLADFQLACRCEHVKKIDGIVDARWIPPQLGVVKINTNDGINSFHQMVGLGAIICDSDGEVLASCGQSVKALNSPLIAEYMVVPVVLLWLWIQVYYLLSSKQTLKLWLDW
ncbi:hypothetical protein ACOSP7_023438 [Xanthoceras sorbifolium]